jgi:hypothetical protein
VPTAALVTPLFIAAWLAVVPPTWNEAYCWQTTLSLLNCSKDRPVPGSTITLGPLGMLTQPVTVSVAMVENIKVKRDILRLLNAVRAVPAQLVASFLSIA